MIMFYAAYKNILSGAGFNPFGTFANAADELI
jgi:hypothetical protein